MSAEERVGSDSPLDVAIDILGKRLDLLIKAYQDAFEVVNGSNLVHVFSSDRGDRLVLRPVAQWFLEDHIHIVFVSVSRELRILQFRKSNRISESSQKTLNYYAGFMEQSSKILFNRARIPVFFAAILAVITAVSYFTGNIMDLTSIKGVAQWLLNLNIDISGIRTFLFLISYGTLSMMVFGSILYIVSRFGFLPKRVIFLGGTIRTKYGDFPPDGSLAKEESEETWEGFPGPNIYNLENRAYDFLGVKKSTEYPLDLFFCNWPMNFSFLSFLVLSILLSYGLIFEVAHDTTFNMLVVFFIVSLSLFVWLIIKTWKTYQKRKRSRNI